MARSKPLPAYVVEWTHWLYRSPDGVKVMMGLDDYVRIQKEGLRYGSSDKATKSEKPATSQTTGRTN